MSYSKALNFTFALALLGAVNTARAESLSNKNAPSEFETLKSFYNGASARISLSDFSNVKEGRGHVTCQAASRASIDGAFAPSYDGFGPMQLLKEYVVIKNEVLGAGPLFPAQAKQRTWMINVKLNPGKGWLKAEEFQSATLTQNSFELIEDIPNSVGLSQIKVPIKITFRKNGSHIAFYVLAVEPDIPNTYGETYGYCYGQNSKKMSNESRIQ